MTVFARRGDVRDRDIVDHPPFVPAAFVVDHEQRRDVGEDIVESARIVRVGRQVGLRLEYDAHCTDRRQAAIAAGYAQLHVVVHPRKDRRKDVRFETGCIEQIILEQLAGLVGFVEHLQWQIGVRAIGQPYQPILQLLGQIDDIAATRDRSAVDVGVRVRVARRSWLFCPSSIDAQDCRNGDRQDRAQSDKPRSIPSVSLHDSCSISFVNHWWTRLRVRSATAPAARAEVTAPIAHGHLRLCPDQQDPAIRSFIPEHACEWRYRKPRLSEPVSSATIYLTP